jgi:hypothetical protein
MNALVYACKKIKPNLRLIRQRTDRFSGRLAFSLIQENHLLDIATREKFSRVYNILFDSP